MIKTMAKFKLTVHAIMHMQKELYFSQGKQHKYRTKLSDGDEKAQSRDSTTVAYTEQSHQLVPTKIKLISRTICHTSLSLSLSLPHLFCLGIFTYPLKPFILFYQLQLLG
jgi:hypothetical protein